MSQSGSDSNDPKRPGKPPSNPDLTRTPLPRHSSHGDHEWLSEIPELPGEPLSNKTPSFIDSDFDIQSLFPGEASSDKPIEPNFDQDGFDINSKSPASMRAPGSGSAGADMPQRSPTSSLPPKPAPSDIFTRQPNRPTDPELLLPDAYPGPDSSHIFEQDEDEDRPRPKPQFDERSHVQPPAHPSAGLNSDSDVLQPRAKQQPDSTDSGDDLFYTFDQPSSDLIGDANEFSSMPFSNIIDDEAQSVNELLDQLNLSFPTPPGSKLAKNPFQDSDSIDDEFSGSSLEHSDPSGSSVFGSGSTSIDDSDEKLNRQLESLFESGDPSDVVLQGDSQASSVNLVDPTTGSPSTLDSVVHEEANASIFDVTLPEPNQRLSESCEESEIDFNLPKHRANANHQHFESKDSAEAGLDWTMPSNHEGSSLSNASPMEKTDVDANLSAFDLESDSLDIPTDRLVNPPSQILRSDSISSIFGKPASVSASYQKRELVRPTFSAANEQEQTAEKVAPLGTRLTKKLNQLALWDGAAKRGRGLLVGAAVGLIAGVGLSGGAYVAFLSEPGTESGRLRVAPSEVKPLAAIASLNQVDLADARRFLAAGEPDRALPALEALGNDASPLILAERGKARWLVRIRELARENQPLTADDPLMNQALADLTQLVNQANQLRTPEEQRVAVEAALQVGLTKELLGDTAGAAAYYTNAAVLFPKAKAIFETATRRMKAMPPAPAGKAALAPKQAHDLAQFLVPTLLLLQTEVDQETNTLPPEAGFLFWEAINEASVNHFEKARSLIMQARSAHDRRRLTLAGRGLNPFSDPLEQIFLRCCNDLYAFWTVKEQLYTHPTAGEVFAKNGLNKITASIDQLSKGKADPKVAEELAAVKSMLSERSKQVEDLAKIANDRAEQLELAERATQAAKKELIQAQANFDQVLETLKQSKLVSADADRETILKELPRVLKSLSATTEPKDFTMTPEDIARLRKNVETATQTLNEREKQLEATRTQLAEAKEAHAKELTKLQTDYDQTIATMKAEAMKSFEATKQETEKAVSLAQKENDELRKKLAAEQQEKLAANQAALKTMEELQAAKAEFTKQLQEQKLAAARQLRAAEDRYQQALAAAQTSAKATQASPGDSAKPSLVPLLRTNDLMNQDKASQLYSRGVEAYFNKQLALAEALLSEAVKYQPNDARYYYFLGLARWGQGQANAEEAFQRGAAAEAANQPYTNEINAALERVQGNARAVLKVYRP